MPNAFDEGKQAKKDKKTRGDNPYLSDDKLWDMGFRNHKSKVGNAILFGVVVIQIAGLTFVTFCM